MITGLFLSHHDPTGIEQSKRVEREEMNFSTKIIYTKQGGEARKVGSMVSFGDIYKPSLLMSIRRHLRSNKFSLFFKVSDIFLRYKVKHLILNGKRYDLNELSDYETQRDIYSIHPDNGLSKWTSDITKLSSLIIVIENSHDSHDQIIFKTNLMSHKNVENKKVNIDKGPIDLQSVNNINFSYKFYIKNNFAKEIKWNTYNHLILKPLPIHNRVIDDIFDIYSFNDEGHQAPLSFISTTDDEVEKRFGKDNNIERDLDLHGGSIEGLKAAKKTKMEAWIKTSKYNMNHKVGKLSIKNYSHYDFRKKKTIISPGKHSIKGYIFPLNAKGMLNTHVTLSPNAAYKKLEIYRQYNIENKVLDIFEGLVSLKISNPNKMSGVVDKTMIFNKNLFKKIILNDLSLKSLQRISNE